MTTTKLSQPRDGQSAAPLASLDSASPELVLRAPPKTPESDTSSGMWLSVIPMLGSLGSVAMVATMSGASDAARERGLLSAGVFLLTTVAFVVAQLQRQRAQHRRRVDHDRANYLHYLQEVRELLQGNALNQWYDAARRHPDCSALPILVTQGRRGAGSPNELRVRHAVASQPLRLNVVLPDSGELARADPVSRMALLRLVAAHRFVPDVPIALPLLEVQRLDLCGSQAQARALARALVCSAAAAHSRQQFAVAVVCSPDRLAHWDWLKWLPHAQSACQHDVTGPRRLVCTSYDELSPLLAAGPHLLLVLDAEDVPPDRASSRSDIRQRVLDLGSTAGTTVAVISARESLASPDDLPKRTRRLDFSDPDVALDQCDPATAEALARCLAAQDADSDKPSDIEATHDEWLDLVGVADPHSLDADCTWRPRQSTAQLKVPLGWDDDGRPLFLDLKEAAQGGMGPHGLVIGATGSGKSEFLRTLVLGLAITHSPEALNLVLVDFKGGATFSGMADLPQVSAIITNLADDLTLVSRMQDALNGELNRRQELLRSFGNFASRRDYESARLQEHGAQGRESMPPLPILFICVDEFSELLAAQPDFIDLFVQIGRLGRSLGVHLLLASQRLDEGRLRGLESHLSYRVGLRTFSAAESHAVLGVPDAHSLPREPGVGYLRTDPETLIGFRAAYVSGPAPPAVATPRRSEHAPADRAAPTPSHVMAFTLTPVTSDWTRAQAPALPAPAPAEPESAHTLMEVLVSRLSGRGPRAHQVWLPPLDRSDTLADLMPDLAIDPDLGLTSRHWRGQPLTLPIGRVDRPREQRRDPFTLTLTGATGHVAVVGGPRSGKSTMIRTMVLSLALVTTPAESQIYLLDFGGGRLSDLAELPHVAAVADRSESATAQRVVAELSGLLERRERHFKAQSIDSIETYRSRRAAYDDGYGDLYLVIDGWATLRESFDGLEEAIATLAARGLSYGIHLIASAGRWSEFRSALRDLFGSRLELRLGDPIDSEIDRRTAAQVPASRPGRGLTPTGEHFLAALPTLPASAVGPATVSPAGQISSAWSGPPGPKLRLLPDSVSLTELRAQAAQTDTDVVDRKLILGMDQRDLAPVSQDVDQEPHLLCFGDGRSGKSALLRTYLREVQRTRTTDEAAITVVDYRRGLMGVVPDGYLLDYLVEAQRASTQLADLANYLHRRLPGPTVTVQQLRDRDWWQGPEVYVVVDDYDLVATGSSNPIQALLPLLPHARDVGLHLIVARRAGGASRALFDPVIAALRDLGAPGVLLSASPEEGALIGGERGQKAAPGRGRMVTREHGTQVLQVAWSDPPA